MLTAYLIGAAIVGGLATFGIFLVCLFTLVSLAENGGYLREYERQDLKGMFKVCFTGYGLALLWPASLLYLPFTIFYHVFADDKRPHAFPRPSFLSWGSQKETVDNRCHGW